jgi:hypothetical protein
MAITHIAGEVEKPSGNGKFVVTLGEGVVKYSARNNPSGTLQHRDLVNASGDRVCIGGGDVSQQGEELYLHYLSADYGPAPEAAVRALGLAILEAYKGCESGVSKMEFEARPSDRGARSNEFKYRTFIERDGSLKDIIS